MSKRTDLIQDLAQMLSHVENSDEVFSHDAYAAYHRWIQSLDTVDLVAEQDAAMLDINVNRAQIRAFACMGELRARRAIDLRKLDEWNRMVSS